MPRSAREHTSGIRSGAKEIPALKAHWQDVPFAGFSPHAQAILTVSLDGTLILFRQMVDQRVRDLDAREGVDRDQAREGLAQGLS